MERTSKVDTSNVLRWKKVGGGFFYLNKNRIIKPNETFEAREEEIPKAFRDSVVCLDPDKLSGMKSKEDEEANLEDDEIYSLEKVAGGKYNVIGATGKPINEKPLTKAQAEALKATMQA